MLAKYIGSQVRLQGVYSGKDNKFPNRYTVVLEDVRVFDLKGNELEWSKDHTWIQDAWTLKAIKDLKPGDRVSCIVTVKLYKNKHGTVNIGFTTVGVNHSGFTAVGRNGLPKMQRSRSACFPASSRSDSFQGGTGPSIPAAAAQADRPANMAPLQASLPITAVTFAP